MFIGHYAVGFLAKRAAPQVSLGTLFLAAQFLDLLWPIFLLLGLEHVRVDPGNTVFTPLDFYDYPLTHSLLGAMGWSLAFAGAYLAVRRSSRNALLLAAVVLSHWILDFVTHRPDLPLTPGGGTKVGLGLWNSLAGTVTVEGALFVLGVVLYTRVSGPRDTTGRYSLWSLVALLTVIWVAGMVAPPPPGPIAVAGAGLGLWLLIPWAYWIERHRRPLAEQPAPGGGPEK